MNGVLRAALAIACTIGCTPPSATPRHEEKPPTEADACARMCDRLATCDLVQPSCAERCEEDRAKMREGVYPAMVSCLEGELAQPICGSMTPPERRERLAVCWSATLEAWSARVGDENLKKVVSAVCARRARCAPDEGTAESCEEVLVAKLAGSVQAKSLAVARPALVDGLAACVSAKACDVEDPVGACSADGPAN